MKKISNYGSWALITGASSGIGTGFAEKLASSGINLVLLARRKEALTALAKHYETKYRIKTLVLDIDLTKNGYLEETMQKTIDLDIGLLVSNAGAGAMGAFIKNDRDTLKSMLMLNVIAQMELAHAFATRFVQRKKQSGILMLSSAAAMQGMPYGGNYSGAKAYIRCLGESLNNELKDHNVNVSVLIPGPTNTPGLTAREDIDLTKLPGKVMSVSDVVDEGLHALLKNKATHIAGLHNRIMLKLMPRKLMIKMGGMMMRKYAPESLSM